MSPCPHSYSRVDEPVADIRHDPRKQADERIEARKQHEEVVVLIGDGVEIQSADAGDGEHPLDDERTRKHENKLT